MTRRPAVAAANPPNQTHAAGSAFENRSPCSFETSNVTVVKTSMAGAIAATSDQARSEQRRLQ
jgi:hypothetical protein